MWQPYPLTACVVLALWGCDERSEIIARERTGGGGGAQAGGGYGAQAGGEAGILRPRFASLTRVDELNDPVAKDQDPTLTEDQLEIFFFSDRSGDADIWRSTRADADTPWDPPMPVPELNTAESEQNPAISRDGLRIWFYSHREPAGIYYAERPIRSEPFGAPEPILINAGDSGGFAIAPSIDVTELRMAISIGLAESRNLYELVRPSLTDSWGDPVLLSGANAESADSTPFLIDDGRELLFHSGRSGQGDLFWAYRESPGLPVVRVEPLSEVNDPVGFESHPHLTTDRRRLYFGSDRGGNTDIYVAEVP